MKPILLTKRGVVGITIGKILYNLNKNILFDKIDYGENLLILYNNTDNHKQICRNFMQQMAKRNSILFYVSHKKNQLNFNFKVQNFFFNIINEDIIHDLKKRLDKRFDEMEKSNKSMLLVSDWSNVDLSNCEIFFPFLEELIERSQGLNPPKWKRKYRGIRQKVPLMLINVFEATDLTDNFIQQIIQLHQRTYLLQENLNTFLLPTISPSSETIFPTSYVLPQRILEKLVKDNLELITFLLLEKDNKSGYQILKEIAQHFHCILSQGTLYPLLYRLEGEKKITKQNGKGREIIYSLYPKVKEQLKLKKEMYLNAHQHLASFF